MMSVCLFPKSSETAKAFDLFILGKIPLRIHTDIFKAKKIGFGVSLTKGLIFFALIREVRNIKLFYGTFSGTFQHHY